MKKVSVIVSLGFSYFNFLIIEFASLSSIWSDGFKVRFHSRNRETLTFFINDSRVVIIDARADWLITKIRICSCWEAFECDWKLLADGYTAFFCCFQKMLVAAVSLFLYFISGGTGCGAVLLRPLRSAD